MSLSEHYVGQKKIFCKSVLPSFCLEYEQHSIENSPTSASVWAKHSRGVMLKASQKNGRGKITEHRMWVNGISCCQNIASNKTKHCLCPSKRFWEQMAAARGTFPCSLTWRLEGRWDGSTLSLLKFGQEYQTGTWPMSDSWTWVF